MIEQAAVAVVVEAIDETLKLQTRFSTQIDVCPKTFCVARKVRVFRDYSGKARLSAYPIPGDNTPQYPEP